MENRGDQPTVVSSAIDYGSLAPWKHDSLNQEFTQTFEIDCVHVDARSEDAAILGTES